MRILDCGFEHTDCIICPFAEFGFENKTASCHYYCESVKMMRLQNTYELSEGISRKIKQCLTLPEMGGILGADINDKYNVTVFYFDSTGQTKRNCYTPDVDALNKIIQDWAKLDIEFIGFVHSHPKGIKNLSPQDIKYANEIKNTCEMSEILMIIYIPETEEFYQYVL